MLQESQIKKNDRVNKEKFLLGKKLVDKKKKPKKGEFIDLDKSDFKKKTGSLKYF